MVVSPHLLSLANGFGRVDSELKRLATPECGYLEYVETLATHVTTLDDSEIALAFGRVPCICGSQGTVERKLELDRPRHIEDAGQPRKKTHNADRELISSLNDQMDAERLDGDGDRIGGAQQRNHQQPAQKGRCDTKTKQNDAIGKGGVEHEHAFCSHASKRQRDKGSKNCPCRIGCPEHAGCTGAAGEQTQRDDREHLSIK